MASCRASDVGGMRDLVRDGKTGFLVPAADPKALAAAISRFFDEDLADSFRQNLEQDRGFFSWSNLAERIRGLACESC